MKKSAFFITALAIILLSGTAISAEYNATGQWNYSEPFSWTDCPFGYTPKTGPIIIVQHEDDFAIVRDDKTLLGTVSGDTYTYTDTYYQNSGWFAEASSSITLNNESFGGSLPNLPIVWSWTDFTTVCSGWYKITIIKIATDDPTHDATGEWKYSQTNFSNDCGFSNPSSTGTFHIQQNENLVTVTDNQSGLLSMPIVGYVSGAVYKFAKIYPFQNGSKSGIISEVFTITLTSGTEGSGDCEWHWVNENNTSESCGGSWDITITAISNTMPSVPLLLLDE